MAANSKVAELYVQLTAQTAEFKKALTDANVSTREFSRQMRDSTREASGAIALLGEEIGVTLNRHLRTFVAQLPGVSQAMSAAFNSVAVLALIGVVVEAGKKVAEFISRNREAAEKLREAQEQFGLTTQKVFSSYQQSLLEAGIKADQLRGDHVDALRKQLELIDRQGFEHLEGAFNQLATAANKAFESIRNNWFSTITQFSFQQAPGYKGTLERFNNEYSSLLAQGKGDEAQNLLNTTQSREEENRAAMVTLRNARIRSWAHSGLIGDPKIQSAIDLLRSRGITDYSDESYNALTQLTGTLEAQQNIASYQRQLTSGQKNNAVGAEAKTASSQLLETVKREFDNLQKLNPMSEGQVASFWQRWLPEFNPKSKEFAEVQKNISDAVQKIHTTLTASLKKLKEHAPEQEHDKAPAGYVITSNGSLALVTDGTEALNQANTKAAESQAKLNAELDAAKDKLALATGAITPHEAAVRQATRAAKEYDDQIAALKKQLSTLQSEDMWHVALGDIAEHTAKDTGLQSQIAELTAKKQIAQIQDNFTILNTTWTGMVDSVFDEIIKKSQDTVEQVQHITTQFVDGINSELAKGMTGQHVNFAGVFQNAAQGLAKTSLERVEGYGAQLLFGKNAAKHKPTGTSSDPIYTKSAEGAAGSILNQTGGSDSGGLFGGFLNWANDNDFMSSLFGGKLFGSGSLFGGHALGGPAMAGVPIPVGELGPEVFVPSVPGQVVPNSQLGSSHVFNIDARGAQDPAQTQAAVHRAMRPYVASSGSVAIAATQDDRRRTPQRGRR